jgi:hypothetical protein
MMRPGPFAFVTLTVMLYGVLMMTDEHAQAQRSDSSVIVDMADEIVILEVDGIVQFRFYTRDAEFNERVPTDATALTVRPEDSTKPVWEIQARSPSSAARQISYGVVPAGFLQKQPPSANEAPKLEHGRRYIATGMARHVAAGFFIYGGQ